MMVYVPLAQDEALRLRAAGVLEGPWLGHAATPGLLRAHDLTGEEEDAEYTALAYAGVTSLLSGAASLRLVLATETADASVLDPDDAFGRVSVPRLRWAAVSSLFADEADSAERLARARRLVDRLDFEQAVDSEQIEELLDASDLLWFAPEELERLPRSTV
ncbi:MAG TPA: hypothetical protein VFP34_19575 [Microlunatus sp.]|nr:hypothetical protein [Microlunatus sp.]